MSSKNDIKRGKWDELIAQARENLAYGKVYVKRMKAALKTLEKNKANGVPWPTESATHN